MKQLIFILAVSGILLIGCSSSDQPSKPAAKSTTATEHISKNTLIASAPVVEKTEAVVEAIPVEPVAPANPGEAVYKKSCIACHHGGAAGAPKLGDTQAWSPRIAKGMDVLLQSVIKGVPGTAMMARGTCGACSDDDLKAAVDYMVSNSK